MKSTFYKMTAMFYLLLFSFVSKNLTNYGRRHLKLFTNCRVSWDPVSGNDTICTLENMWCRSPTHSSQIFIYPPPSLPVEMGAVGFFKFCSFIMVENDRFSSFFFQLVKNKLISFLLKTIVHFSSISFVFSVKDRSVKPFFQ